MNYNTMSIEELKNVARDKGIHIGNAGREKLIEKLIEADNISDVMANDEDLVAEPIKDDINEEVAHQSVLESISSAIDELDESIEDGYDNSFVDVPKDTVMTGRSITFGRLIYKSPTNNSTVIWNNIGAVRQMTIAELTEMNNQSPEFLTNPNVILLNEDAIRMFRLNSVYENVAQINNLKSLFKQSTDTIEKAVDRALMANMRDVLISKIRAMYNNKSLTDINVIKLLEEKLQFDLT